MAASLTLGFGRLSVAIEQEAVALPTPMPASLRRFLAPLEKNLPTLQYCLSSAAPPSALDAAVVSTPVWRLMPQGEGYILEITDKPRGDPALVAAVSSDFGKGTWHVPQPPSGQIAGPEPLWLSPLLHVLIAHGALPWGGLLVHGALVHKGPHFWLLCGPSGAGKSTTAARLHAGGFRTASEDRSLLFANPQPKGAAKAYATPFASQPEHPSSCLGGVLAGILFVRQANHTTIARLRPAAATARIMAATLGPFWREEPLQNALKNAHAVALQVPCLAAGLNLAESTTAELLAAMQPFT